MVISCGVRTPRLQLLPVKRFVLFVGKQKDMAIYSYMVATDVYVVCGLLCVHRKFGLLLIH